MLLQLGSLLPQQHQVATPALPLHQPLTTTFEVFRIRCRVENWNITVNYFR